MTNVCMCVKATMTNSKKMLIDDWFFLLRTDLIDITKNNYKMFAPIFLLDYNGLCVYGSVT